MQRQRQTQLDVGADLPDDSAGGLVGLHDQLVPVGGAGTGETLRFGHTEYLHGLLGNGFLVRHHFFHVQAHLDAAVDLTFGGLRHHLLPIPFGDGSHLHAHIGFIDGADVVQLAAQTLHEKTDIAGKIGGSGLSLPAALGNQPHRAGEVVQRHHRLQPVCLAAGDDLAVMLHLGFVKAALLRLNARPFDGKAVGVQPGFGHQANILLVAVIMVYRVQTGLHIAGMLHLFLCPAVIMNVVALHLMGGGGGADEKFRCKFLHHDPPFWVRFGSVVSL